MLPLEERWYRRLLLAALGLGLAGGVIGLLYHGVTVFGISRLFGEPTADPLSGQWWWIPLVAGGAVAVAYLRRRTGVGGKIPGAVPMARQGWVEPRTAPQLVILSAISLMVGASLGPSFGVIVATGGLGSWLVSRRSAATTEEAPGAVQPKADDVPTADDGAPDDGTSSASQSSREDERRDTALTGMAGGLGALFAAPLFAAIMASELSPTPKRGYVAAFIPQFLAATIGFVIFFGVSGSAMLGTFDVSGYDFHYWHLIAGVGLGLVAVAVVALQALIAQVVERGSELLTNQYLRAALMGGLVGAIAFALPLTATGGQTQLAYETDHLRQLGVGLLLAVLVGKMFAFSLSQAAGFLGGSVFPMLFIGGTAGVLVHELFPDIPAALAIAAMLAAVPGAIIGAPVSFILIGVGTVTAGIEAIPPIGIAVVVAHIGGSAVQRRRRAPAA